MKGFGAMPQDISLGRSGDGEDASIGSHHFEMPCKEFEDQWENLIYEDEIKCDVKFIEVLMWFLAFKLCLFITRTVGFRR